MTYLDSHAYFARKWEIFNKAKEFPKLVQACDYALTFTLGRDDFGFSYGSFSRRYAGPVLDLTGAKVELICEVFPAKPSLLEAASGEEWQLGATVFSVTGVVSSPATAGIVIFTLTDQNTDAVGDAIAMIKITTAAGLIIVPGYVKLTFLERLG